MTKEQIKIAHKHYFKLVLKRKKEINLDIKDKFKVKITKNKIGLAVDLITYLQYIKKFANIKLLANYIEKQPVYTRNIIRLIRQHNYLFFKNEFLVATEGQDGGYFITNNLHTLKFWRDKQHARAIGQLAQVKEINEVIEHYENKLTCQELKRIFKS